jgi:hypothetical protein
MNRLRPLSISGPKIITASPPFLLRHSICWHGNPFVSLLACLRCHGTRNALVEW